MPSRVLRNLVQAINTSKTSNFAAPIAGSLILATVGNLCQSSPPSKEKAFQLGRREASTSAKTKPYGRHADGFVYGASGLPIDLEAAVFTRRRQGGPAWVTLIEPYLPLKLRDGVRGLLEEQSNSKPLQSITSLPLLLSSARQKSNIDLLSYLGVYQGRWEAVMWLVKAMMEHTAGRTGLDEQSKQLSSLVWPSDNTSLQMVTEEPLRIHLPHTTISSLEHFGDDSSLNMMTEEPRQIKIPQASKLSLDDLTNTKEGNSVEAAIFLGHQSLGQIWQSLGTMILQAADRSPDDPDYIIIMTQVFRVLGHLHRISAFPDTIYNYTPATDPTVLQRPPTLHLLSRRIMSTLSDVEFSIHWEAEILKYEELGYELSKTSVPLKVREFGPELWMDLVLWACVEGGWIMEGAWIVKEIDRRQGSRNKRWSAISWPEICARKAPQLDWTSIVKLEIDRTRLNQVGGIGIATGTHSSVDMGTRTVSREVILAIMDGLLNVTHSRQSTYGASSSQVQQSITACKSLLECDHPDLNTKFLNLTILRLIESTGVDSRDSPGALQRIVDLRRMTAKNGKIADATLSAQDAETDDAAAILGLLHRILYGFARGENLQGSLTTFKKIQDIIDTNREERIQNFADELRVRSQEADRCDDIVKSNIEHKDQVIVPSLSPQIPISVLIAFLDLIIDSKFYDIGKWLIDNDDVDGSAIGPKLYADPNLQSALIRFATATADDNLMNCVLERAEPPLSEAVLHALLHCQVVLGRWSKVKDVLQYFQKTTGVSWKASDAMAIASTILQLEHGHRDIDTMGSISQAQSVLSDLISGKYNSQQDPSELPDLSEAKTANQLGRIFKTLPDSVRKTVTETPRETYRAHTSITINPNAFNILLEALLECYGPLAGKRLWKRWCREPTDTAPKSSPTINYVDGHTHLPAIALEEDLEEERVVTPTIYMLRNILRPILRIRQRPVSAKSGEADCNLQSPALRNENIEKDLGAGAERTNPEAGRRPLTEQEQDILQWGISMFRKFGRTDREINLEMPGAIPFRKREQPPLQSID